MTEAQTKATEIYSKFEQISKDNETYIPPYLICEMCHIAINLIMQEDIDNWDFWTQVDKELIKLNFVK